jgi:hypothetical protein
VQGVLDEWKSIKSMDEAYSTINKAGRVSSQISMEQFKAELVATPKEETKVEESTSIQETKTETNSLPDDSDMDTDSGSGAGASNLSTNGQVQHLAEDGDMSAKDMMALSGKLGIRL